MKFKEEADELSSTWVQILWNLPTELLGELHGPQLKTSAF